MDKKFWKTSSWKVQLSRVLKPVRQDTKEEVATAIVDRGCDNITDMLTVRRVSRNLNVLFLYWPENNHLIHSR